MWCKREDALDLSDATDEEQKELFKVLRKLKKAVELAFQPDWFNYSFLGNQTHHLHAHFVPRYAKTRIFAGVNFEDKFYGHNFKTNQIFKVPEKVLNKIISEIKKLIK